MTAARPTRQTSAGFQPARRGTAVDRTHRRPPHAEATAAAFFVSTRSYRSKRVFTAEAARLAVEALWKARSQYKFLLLAYVFMPDHAHFVICPHPGFSIAQTMRVIKGGIAASLNQSLNRQGPVWQSGFFDRSPGSLEQLNAYIEYTNNNPVVAGLATSKEQFAFSSGDGRCLPDYELFLEVEREPDAELAWPQRTNRS